MQFQREKLISMVDSRITVYQYDGERDLMERQAAYDKMVDDWKSNYVPLWRDLVELITDQLEDDGVVATLGVMLDTIKYNSHQALLDAKRPEEILSKYTDAVNRFQRLKSVLEAASDQTVSETSLQKMGFKLTDLVNV